MTGANENHLTLSTVCYLFITYVTYSLFIKYAYHEMHLVQVWSKIMLSVEHERRTLLESLKFLGLKFVINLVYLSTVYTKVNLQIA